MGRDGEEDGPGEADGHAVVAGVGGDVEGGAGGEAAERGLDLLGDGGDVVEGLNPGLMRLAEERVGGGGQRLEGGFGGVEEIAEHGGGQGFAGSGFPLQDEDGIGAFGAHGGEQPGEDAMEAVVVDAEEIFELVESFGAGGFGWGDGAGAAGADEGEVTAVVDGPAVLIDFEDEVLGVGGGAAEVEGDGFAKVLRVAGEAGVFGIAAGYAEGGGGSRIGAAGGTAVEEIAGYADLVVVGEFAVFIVVVLAEEGGELLGAEGGDVALVQGVAGDEGVGDAFGAAINVGLFGAGEETLDLFGSGVGLVIRCHFFDFPSLLVQFRGTQ